MSRSGTKEHKTAEFRDQGRKPGAQSFTNAQVQKFLLGFLRFRCRILMHCEGDRHSSFKYRVAAGT